MADKKFTWEAVIDTRGAIRSVNELADALKRSLQNGSNKVEIVDKASIEAAKQSARSAAAEIIESQRRMTIEARAAGQERSSAARAEASVVAEAAKSAAAARAEAEKRSTAILKSELAEQARAIRETQAAASGAGAGGGQSALVGGLLGYLSIQGARQIFSYAQEIGSLNTQIGRVSKAFEVMAGSASAAEKQLNAIKTASGGTVDNLTAMQIANQASALGLARTSTEFEKLTRAARAVTFVSPVIRDVQSAITELALASANLSYRRLDQLGLSVTEVRTRVQELMSANKGLDESQAFLQASVDALNSKFGALLDSTEANAGGVERLSTAWQNLTQDIASSRLGELANAALADLAGGIDRINALVTGNNSQFGSLSALNGLIGDIKGRPAGSIFEQSLPDLERLKAMFEEINQLATAGVPGIDSFSERIAIMTANVVEAGYVSAEASAEINQFQSIVSAAASILDAGSVAGKYYADAVKLAGSETVNTDEKTSALVTQMVNLGVQQEIGAVSAETYATQIAILGAQLLGMASQAAIAAGELARVNQQTAIFYGAANEKLYYSTGGQRGTQPIGPPTFQQAGQIPGYMPSAIPAPWESGGYELNAFEQARVDRAEFLAKEQEKADKEAAAAAKRAANTAEKLFNTAQQELKSTIDSVVGVSQVTQQDIEDAKNGIYQEKADEYLRQLRDEIQNGKDYENVSIEDAAAGLNKIGVDTAGKSSEAILKLFENAFADLSLFADKDNLKFLNDGAVEQQLKLKELAKQGQQNVYDHYGVVVGQAIEAAMGGGGGYTTGTAEPAVATGATPAAINIDGKGIAGQGLDITATVVKVDFKLSPEDTEKIRTALSTAITPRLDLAAPERGFYLGAEDAAKIRDNLAAAITPTLDLGAPEQGFKLSAEDAARIKDDLAAAITPTIDVLLDATQQEQDLLATRLSQNIVPIITPMLGEPDLTSITALQLRITEMLNSDQAANPTPQGSGLGNVLVANGQKTKANPIATRYVNDLVASFSAPETTLPLLGVGAFMLGVIDSGFELAKSETNIGNDIVTTVNSQTFSESNVALIKSIGFNIFQFIVAGIRMAQARSDNNIGQQIVDGIVAQVIDATATAVETTE